MTSEVPFPEAERQPGAPEYAIEWDGDPLPIDRRGRPPTFPVECLPPSAAAMVKATAIALQVPEDLPAALFLAVASTAAGGRTVVEVREGWRESTNIYIIPVMPSGCRKSPVYAEMIAPIERAEIALKAKARVFRAQAFVEAEIRTGQAQRAREAAIRAPEDQRDTALADAISATEAAMAVEVPAEPELIVDDVTSEALQTALAEQGGRAALLAPEGDGLMTLAGRYTQGKPNPRVLLAGWCGERIRVKRQGRPPQDVPHAYLTIGICLQPEMLQDIADVPGFRGRGVLARNLYSVPHDTVGYRRVGAPPIPAAIRDAYVADMESLVLSLHDWTDPAVLTLTRAAAALHLQFERDVEPRLRRDLGDLGDTLREWGSKLVGQTVRLAALLHLGGHVRDGWGTPISKETMASAIQLAEYFIAHARIAFGDMTPDPAAEKTIRVLDWITAQKKPLLARRDIHTGVRTRKEFVRVAELQGPLNMLVELGYLQLAEKPGRRSEIYAVHPSLLEGGHHE